MLKAYVERFIERANVLLDQTTFQLKDHQTCVPYLFAGVAFYIHFP